MTEVRNPHVVKYIEKIYPETSISDWEYREADESSSLFNRKTRLYCHVTVTGINDSDDSDIEDYIQEISSEPVETARGISVEVSNVDNAVQDADALVACAEIREGISEDMLVRIINDSELPESETPTDLEGELFDVFDTERISFKLLNTPTGGRLLLYRNGEFLLEPDVNLYCDGCVDFRLYSNDTLIITDFGSGSDMTYTVKF